MSGNGEKRALRVRSVVGSWFWVLVVACIVIVAASGWITYSTHLEPGTHAEERIDSSWTTEATFDHEATVVESNPVFPYGSTLENRGVYYTSIAPEFNGTYAFSYGSSVDGDLAVDTSVYLQLRSVGEDDDGSGNGEQTVYWNKTRPLSNKTVSGLSPGETVRTSFSLNTSQVDQRLDEIESSLGGTAGSTEARIVVQSDIEGTVAGEAVQDQSIHSIPISMSGGTYSFADDAPWREEYTQTRMVQVPNEYGPLRSIGVPVVGLLALLGLLALGFVYARELHELSPDERATLEFYRDRSSYDEWISRARLPEDAVNENPALVSSLEELVDIAIDTDERVIEDPGRNAFIVRHDGVHYVYSPPVQLDSSDDVSDTGPL